MPVCVCTMYIGMYYPEKEPTVHNILDMWPAKNIQSGTIFNQATTHACERCLHNLSVGKHLKQLLYFPKIIC